MGRDLPARAERFLHKLARKLQSLSSAERDAVLLELRSHLTDRAAQSEATLDKALEALGDPAELAAEFDQREGAGLAPVPRMLSIPWRPMRVTEVLLEVRATFFASRDGLIWVGLVLTAFLAATSFLLWTNLRLRGLAVEGWSLVALQAAASLLAVCAGYRLILTNMRRPWRVTPSTLRFIAAMIAVDSISFAAVVGMDRAITDVVLAAGETDSFVPVGRRVWTTLCTVVMFCIALRIQPWLVGLAIGRSDVTIQASWQGTAGRVLNILRGWIVLVLPLYILHLALHSFVLERVPLGILTPFFAVLAGLVSVSIALASILLNATIFRWAVGEPIPSARPFATEPPDSTSVEEARARLARLLQSQRPKFHRG